MFTINTRLANNNDVFEIAKLFDLYRQFYEQVSDIHLAQAYIQARIERKESVIIVAEMENQVIGFCQMYPTFCSIEAAPIYSLYDLFVHPDFRRTGAGKTLLLAAEQHTKQAGCVRMDLTTARTNIQAQNLYEALGWIRDEVYFAYSKSVTKPSII
jgi:ribosomal protein S18 acetylase RimI-like enzyme